MQSPQRRNGHRRGGSQTVAARDQRADLEPQRAGGLHLRDRGLHIAIPGLIDRTAVRPPFRMGPGVHLGPEVDRRAESRLPEDDRMLSEEDQLSGSGGRHRPRFPPTRLNLSGSADFWARWEPGGQATIQRGVSRLRLDLLQRGLEVSLFNRDLLQRRLVQVRYFVAVSRIASIAASLHTAASSAPVYLSVLRAMSSRSTSFPSGFRRA